MGKKPRDPFDIPDIPDIPGLEDDDESAAGAGAGGSPGGGERRATARSPSSGKGGRRSSGPGAGAASAGPGKKTRKSRRALFFFLGLIFGVAAALILPPLATDYLGPDLPRFLGGGGQEVSGPVLGKRMAEGRLLLTIETAEGALLATFTERVSEVDLLVSEGDTVRLGVSRYQPFVTEPDLLGIRKGATGAGGAAPVEATDTGGAAPAATDTGGPAPEPADTTR